MFVIVDRISVFHTAILGVFMICHYVKYHMSSSSGSLAVIVILKDNCEFSTVAQLP